LVRQIITASFVDSAALRPVLPVLGRGPAALRPEA